MERTAKITAGTGRTITVRAEQRPNADAEADARITDTEVDGLYAPRSREEAKQRRSVVEAARAADYATVIDYDDDELEDLLARTVFNYPQAGGR